jgi:hypothetical protein
MDNDNSNIRLNRLKEEAAKQYVVETSMEMPSIPNSEVTIANGTEIIILRDNESKIVAHYQLLKDYKFFRMDNKE